MTQEEKAHCYDEAIKVANKYKDTHIMFPQIKDEIFPELAESDDEKIRKALIDYFRWNPNSQLLNEFTNREVFAWLEKQNSNVDNANKEYWRGYREGKQEVLDKYAEFEKQCEQKLYINDNAKEMFIKALERVEEQNNKGYKLTDCDKNSWWEDFKAYTYCTIVQKPADIVEPKFHEGDWGHWSEEDEMYFNSIAHALSICLIDPSFDEINLGHTAWFKSLKDRVQPKQEWSEEDERKLQLLIVMCDETKGDSVTYSTMYREMEELKTWLKSLRPQNTWKPSDEHYELEEFAKIVRGNLTGISKAVQELFEAKYLQLTGNKMYREFKD